MINTLRISFSLRMTYKINAVLYFLRQIPLIGKHLPEKLHCIRWLKVMATVVAFGWELLSGLLSKGVYLGLAVFLPVMLMENEPLEASAFMQIFVLMALLGGLHNNDLLSADESSYYAISLLGMDARAYTLVNYGYQLVKLNVGYLIFGLLLGMVVEVPWWMCLLMGPFTSGAKCFIAALDLCYFERTGQVEYAKPGNILLTVSAVVLLALAYGPPFLGFALPLEVTLGIMLCVCVAGAVSVRKLLTFKEYRVMHQQNYLVYSKAINAPDVTVESSHENISNDTSIRSGRRGFAYLNELFIKRHKKVMWGAAIKSAAIAAVLLTAVAVLCLFDAEMAGMLNENIMSLLPFFPFALYMFNIGTSYTQALFINCDHSLLTYSFYKQPGMILRLFRIRLWGIIKVNLLPGLVMAVGAPAVLLASGGTDNMLDYLVLFSTVVGLNVFFSVHYLTLYYLLQPYNAGSQMKNGAYQFVTGATYAVCYMLTQGLEVPGVLFGGLCVAFCLVYCVVACVLVYFLAPRTFRIRT